MINLKRFKTLLIVSAGLVTAALLSACGSGDQGRDPVLGLPSATLVSVVVTPATASIAIGATQQLTATAAYNDGSAVDVTAKAAWTSAAPTIATVSAAGVSTGVSAGAAVITAVFQSKSGTSTITVLPAKLLSIALQPPVATLNIGKTLQYAVIGSFDDKSTRDITAASAFAAATPATATIDASGLATAKVQGTTGITATSGGLSASASLTVLPANVVSLALTPATTTLQPGASRQLAATATYSDGTVADVTANSLYTSAHTEFVTISNRALITGVATGTSVLTASFSGQTATAQANTAALTVSSIAVSPATAAVAVGATQQFIAVATYSDNSTAIITSSAAWTSSNTAVATVLNTGVATGVTAGTATMTATSGGKSGSGVLTVTAPGVPVAPGAPVTPVTPVTPTPAAVNLRSAADFAVLAGTSLTNNAGGTTFIIGNVGSPSQTTAPTVAPGYTNYRSGAILDTALADLQTAITDANSRTCDVTFAANIDLGGLALPPGVYCYAGTISVTGTLNLNGTGVYIFRTAQTLNTTANSSIVLTNGAAAENVTWVPTGPTTLGANSVFVGSVLGQSAAITVGDNTTLLTGRVLSAAAVTLSNNQITK
jgi:uncharacterized protein YjdB